MRLVLLLVFTLSVSIVFAQESEVDESASEINNKDKPGHINFTYQIPEQYVFAEEKIMSAGAATGFVLVVDNMKDKDVKNRWKDFMKANDSKTKKVKGVKDESINQGVKMYDVSNSPIDIYSTIYNTGETNEFVVWIKDGDNFISADNQQGDAAKKMMSDFGVYIERRRVEKELDEEEKQYKKKTKEYDKLAKDKRNLEKDIVDWQKDILEAEQKIEQNILLQEIKTKEVVAQKAVYELVKKKLSLF